MKRYQVTLSATGEATVTVEAADADQAVEIALRLTPGPIVGEGAVLDWAVEDVWESRD